MTLVSAALIGCQAHRETTFPAYVSDYLPTFLDVVGIPHEEPTWAADGISLIPFIRQTQKQTAVDVVACVILFCSGYQRARVCRVLHSGWCEHLTRT